MNGRTAKMIRKYAFLSSMEKKDRRAMKRNWNGLPGDEKRALRNKITKTNGQLAVALSIKQEIERNRSVRKHTLVDGTRALWFASDKIVGEATFYLMPKGGRVASVHQSSPDTVDESESVLVDEMTFNKFWEFAVEDALPQPHFELLSGFAAPSLGGMA